MCIRDRLLIKEDGNKALQATLNSVSITAADFASVSATSVSVKYNSDGANAVNLGTLNIDGVTADLNVNAGVTSFKAIGFSAAFANFVTIGGDFAFRKTQVSAGPPAVNRLEVVASNVSVSLTLGSVFTASASGGSLALLIKEDGNKALQATLNSVSITAADFASVSATSVSVKYNSDGANAVNLGTLTIDGVTADLNVNAGVTSFKAIGFSASFANLVTIGGDFAFRKTQVSAGPPAVNRLEVVASNVSVSLSLGSVFTATASNGSLALLIKEDGNKALQATLNSVSITAADFASVSATSVSVKYNSDGANAVNLGTLNIDGVTADLNVNAGVTSFKAIGFSAAFANFVTIGGDFAFRKTQVSAGPPAVNRLEVVASNVSVSLTLGSVFTASASGGSLALLIKEDGNKALQATLNSVSITAADFASVSATSVSVKYNSDGANAVNLGTLTIDGVTADLNVNAGVTSFKAIGFSASFANLVTIGGDFAFRKTQVSAGPPAVNRLEVVASNVSVSLSLGSVFTATASNGSLALLIKEDGNKALQATLNSVSITAADFASVSATSVSVKYNSDGANAVNLGTLTIDGVTADLNVNAGVTSFKAIGFSASFANLVTIGGDFAFRKTQVSAGPPAVNCLEVVASNVSVSLSLGSVFTATASNGSLALLIKEDGNKALQATLNSVSITAADFASVSATSVSVKYNSDGANAVNLGTLTIDGVTADLNVNAGVTSFKAIGFSASFANFVTIGGDFAFRKTQVSAGPPAVNRLEVVASNVSVSLSLGSVFTATASNGSLALLIKEDGNKALQATLNSVSITAADFASVSATSVSVKYNSDVANAVNLGTLNIDGVTADLNVNAGVTSFKAIGFSAAFANFVTIGGD